MTTTVRFIIGLSVLLCGVILTMGSCATHNDMAPNIMNGTWYWHTQNSHYDIGDIVVLKDPHGDRTLIRRVVAKSGDSIRIHNDGIVVNDRRLPQLDMRHWSKDARVWQELSTIQMEKSLGNTFNRIKHPLFKQPKRHFQQNMFSSCVIIGLNAWILDGGVHFPKTQFKENHSYLCLFCNDGMN